jgi:RNA polymerase sigma factor (TIGR02999 family)
MARDEAAPLDDEAPAEGALDEDAEVRPTGDGVTVEFDEEVYRHLHALAGRIYTERGGVGSTIQPTALLHEAWEKLAKSSSRYRSRAHFMAVAARAMRQVMISRARARNARKRGGDWTRATLTGLGEAAPRVVDVIDLDAAIRELEEQDAKAAEVVMLRTFGGLTVEEVAEVTGASPRTVARTWRFAKSFLAARLRD